MNPDTILIATTLILMFGTLLGVSSKTGFVSYSMLSLLRKDQPKFVVDWSRISGFTTIVFAAFLANVVFCLFVLPDTNEPEAILLYSLFNTVVIAYGLSYWLLLKEKTKGK